jgi:putative ABC transport system permease protein
VATPQLLDYLGVDPETVPEAARLLTRVAGPVDLTGDILRSEGAPRHSTPDRLTPGRVPGEAVTRIDVPAYRSAPRSLLTPEAVEAGGWTAAPAGWLVESPHPLTGDQLDAARALAVRAGLTVEDREAQGNLATVRTVASLAGVLLALGILAMTVGLIRSESSRDVRTLTAVGAPRRTRRTVTASTAGGLALVAAILGTIIAYLALGAGYWPDTDRLTGSAPVLHLGAIVLGFPVLATSAGWLLGGREPARLGGVAGE